MCCPGSCPASRVGGSPAVSLAGRAPFEVAARIDFTSNGVASGCFARMRAAIPAMCGAAKLLPVAIIRPPSFQATVTSTP